MKSNIILLWIIYMFCSLSSEEECNSNRENGYCCDGFYRNVTTDTCDECPNGFYYLNCSLECEKGYYGRRCFHICHCTVGQTCDHIQGCIDIPSSVGEETTLSTTLTSKAIMYATEDKKKESEESTLSTILTSVTIMYVTENKKKETEIRLSDNDMSSRGNFHSAFTLELLTSNYPLKLDGGKMSPEMKEKQSNAILRYFLPYGLPCVSALILIVIVVWIIKRKITCAINWKVNQQEYATDSMSDGYEMIDESLLIIHTPMGTRQPMSAIPTGSNMSDDSAQNGEHVVGSDDYIQPISDSPAEPSINDCTVQNGEHEYFQPISDHVPISSDSDDSIGNVIPVVRTDDYLHPYNTLDTDRQNNAHVYNDEVQEVKTDGYLNPYQPLQENWTQNTHVYNTSETKTIVFGQLEDDLKPDHFPLDTQEPQRNKEDPPYIAHDQDTSQDKMIENQTSSHDSNFNASTEKLVEEKEQIEEYNDVMDNLYPQVQNVCAQFPKNVKEN